MYKLVLLRHGQSTWNKEGKFTGWTDVGLTEQGVNEAIESGKLLKEEGFHFDIAYTSYLKRAIKTLWLTLEEMDLMWIPVVKDWRLNERHYGALQGLSKKGMAAEHGNEQVHIWRRSYDTPPPKLESNDKRHSKNEARYQELSEEQVPMSECLKDTVERVLPYWNEVIAPDIKSGRKVIIAAHGNSLRALAKHLDEISDEEIPQLNIPTGIPLVYELDENLKPIKSYYLGDQEAIKKAAEAVKNQGKA